MENKKDIGRAVRDKLEGLQKQPAPAVWERIRTDLDAVKKPRRFPLWGIAVSIIALLVLATLLTYPLWKSTIPEGAPSQTEETRTTDGVNKNDVLDSTNPQIVNADAENKSANAASENTDSQTIQSGKETNTDTLKNKYRTRGVISADDNGSPDNNQAAHTANGKKKVSKNTSRNKATVNNVLSNSLKNTSPKDKTSVNSNKRSGGTKAKTSVSQKVKSRNGYVKSAAINKEKGLNGLADVSAGNQRTHTRSGADNTTTLAEYKNSIADPNNKITNGREVSATGQDSSSVFAKKRVSGSDFTVTPEIDKTIEATEKEIDSLAIAKATDSLALKRADTLSIDKKVQTADVAGHKQFYAFAYAAPAAFKYPSGTSLIGRELNGNKAGSKTAVSYGAFIGFEVTERWGIRTGIAITRTEQETSGIVTDTIEAVVPSYSGIRYATGVSNTTLSTRFDGQPFNLIQKTQLTEIPIELTYRLTGQKWGVKAIGGISLVRISSNEVTAQNNSGSLPVGSLKNISDISFSTGIGAGLYYRLSPSLQLNAEPFARYYINTFKDAKPISFSLRIGLQYNFNFNKKKK